MTAKPNSPPPTCLGHRERLRVHVNGTRGKSGVTRLIAAGLRGGGYRPFAKVTGTAAKWIEPDGTERAIARRGLPNIRELIETVRQATRSQADALVCECMALQPELQEFCEQRLIRSHIGVITNVRHDHEEVMGPDLPAIAASLARTAPQGGTLVVTPETAALLPKSATDACRLRIVDPASVSAQELAGFAFAVEAENVALALAVCELAWLRSGAGMARRRIPNKRAAHRNSLPDRGRSVRRQDTAQGRGRNMPRGENYLIVRTPRI